MPGALCSPAPFLLARTALEEQTQQANAEKKATRKPKP